MSLLDRKEKEMKKIVLIVLICILIISLIACSTPDKNEVLETRIKKLETLIMALNARTRKLENQVDGLETLLYRKSASQIDYDDTVISFVID